MLKLPVMISKYVLQCKSSVRTVIETDDLTFFKVQKVVFRQIYYKYWRRSFKYQLFQVQIIHYAFYDKQPIYLFSVSSETKVNDCIFTVAYVRSLFLIKSIVGLKSTLYYSLKTAIFYRRKHFVKK